MGKLLYFDNAATTEPCAEAREAFLTSPWYNPSSMHAGGTVSAKALEESRDEVSRAFGASGMNAGRIVFTSGGTESDVWVITSAVKRRAKHIVTTAIEHDAVLNACREAEARGVEVTYVAPGPDGAVRVTDIESAVRRDTFLVSVMSANNETGVYQPIAEISRMLKRIKSRALLHTDAVQAFMKTERPAASCGADLISASAHKVHGYKGTGALYIRNGVHLAPLIPGGGQESGDRSGTENLAGIAAFAAACRAHRPDEFERVAALRDLAADKIAAVGGLRLLRFDNASPYILNVALPGKKSEVALRFLSDRGICVSSGSACAKGKKSHVLTAMGMEPELIDSFLRLSFSRYNTPEEIDALASALAAAERELR